MKAKLQIIDDIGSVYEGTLTLTKLDGKKQNIKKTPNVIVKVIGKKIKPSEVIKSKLYELNFFKDYKDLSQVEKKLNDLGYHFKKNSIYMALNNANYLIKSGKKGNYKFIQKYPSGDM